MSYNFFEDPAMIALKNSLSPEEREKRRIQGEYIHSLDYEKLSLDGDKQLLDFVAYIEQGLKSGLRPRDLYPDEKEVMRKTFGDAWFCTRYEFASEDD